MSIRDALQLKAVTVTIPSGIEVTLRRPSTMDLLAAVEQSKERPQTFAAWLVQNHVIEGGGRVFLTVDEVMGYDVQMVDEIAREVEKLYSEGKN